MLLELIGLVVAIGVLGIALQTAVSDVQGGGALVAVRIPVLAGDIFLGADSVDICLGFVHKGVYRLAVSLGHIPALHHLVAVGGAAGGAG